MKDTRKIAMKGEFGKGGVHFEISKITSEGEIVNVNPTYWLNP